MNGKRYSVLVAVCKQAVADNTKEIGYSEARYITTAHFLSDWQSEHKGAKESAPGFYARNDEGEWEQI